MNLPTLELHSERASPTGNLASEGALNQLGRPHLDPLAVLVRESVQNCWDAHLPDDPHVEVRFDIVTLDSSLRNVLRWNILTEPAHGLEMHERLADPRPMHMLVISDRNTTGLGGPTRADIVQKKGAEPADFVNFLRDIGQPTEEGLGGGTYGYGKAALYLSTRMRTLVAFTRCRFEGRPQSRFMAACLGRGFTLGRNKYTGRHWWGEERDGIVEPLLGGAAERIAAALGLPRFGPGEYGTSIALLDADFGLDRPPEEALRLIRDALLWNFWPKMLDGQDGRPSMSFSLGMDGALEPLPDPRSIVPLNGFCQAMDLLKAAREGAEVPGVIGGMHRPIEYGSTRDHLGDATCVRFPHASRWGLTREGDWVLGGIEAERCHHIALMRDAELVVRYLEGPEPPNEILDWAGVFIASQAADRAFAASEPPTHDDWVHKNVADKHKRSYVNVALRRIREFMAEYATPTGAMLSEAAKVPLGMLSSVLGGLLTGAEGTGVVVGASEGRPQPVGPSVVDTPDEELPFRSPGDDGGGGESDDGKDAGDATGDEEVVPTVPGKPDRSVGRPKLAMKEAKLEIADGVGCLVVPFELKTGTYSKGSRISVQVQVELDGRQAEKEPPEGAEMPGVLFWLSPDGRREAHGESTIDIPRKQAGEWQVWIKVIDDARIRARVRGAAVESE